MENKTKNKVLLYGANGYTGKLIAKTLLAKGLNPILAARSNKVTAIGKELACETRIFTTQKASEFLVDTAVLINIAGPFAKTQDDLIKACIQTKTHYLDIAGEVPEMERAYQYHEQAKFAGISIIAGAGFGVVPTDIAAKLAASQIQKPDSLVIAYATEGRASRGTLQTVLKDITKVGVKIVNGQQALAKPAFSDYTFTVGQQKFKAVYNPWRADLFTAGLSTGIPNIETYSVFPGFVVSMMKGKLGWLRKLMLNYVINWLPEGPAEKELKKGKTFIQTKASNNHESATVTIKGPEAYIFTAECVYVLTKKLLQRTEHQGFITPSMFGQELIEAIDKVTITIKKA